MNAVCTCNQCIQEFMHYAHEMNENQELMYIRLSTTNKDRKNGRMHRLI
jgi:hypothetical protein